MRYIASLLVTPLFIFFILIIISLILYNRKKLRWSKAIFITAFAWLFIITTQLLSNYPTAFLEGKYASLIVVPDSMPHQETHVLILGGGHENDPTLPYREQLTNLAYGRLIEGIQLYKQIPNCKIITSGYSGNQIMPQAEVLKRAALENGVPDSVIITISEPWNTKNEAFEYNKRFGNQYNLILVTDAIHMHRSLYHFKNIGLKPLPAPVNFIVKKSNKPFYEKIVPSGRNLYNVERTMHEYIGLLWAYIGGN
ncbi:MAG TPA: ElyC/SanA/YdcF family protein [Salinivirgaceae bacterium]|nr:ElyC/SanA/YdcF family protein [Salinivirgaceae bacterium]